MGSFREITGNLITLALAGEFDVIAHGCNCMCTMGAGLAVPMKNTFGCDKFKLEHLSYRGDIDKLGTIDYQIIQIFDSKVHHSGGLFMSPEDIPRIKSLIVVNAYTQFMYGKNHMDGVDKPVDYEAITLVMRKMNLLFKGKRIGLPRIGCQLAGGDWNIVREIIRKELVNCDVTCIEYDGK